MEPLYKIGDLVLIKNQRDPGKNSWDYSCGFLDEMIAKYGGKLLKIRRIIFRNTTNTFVYYLEGNHWSWTEDMFHDICKEF